MFKKILIANRGEIAVRVIRAARELGVRTAAAYSEADRNCIHVLLADEAYCIGPAPSIESYLSIERIMEAAKGCRAEAIHPGYGFLAENPEFARACEESNIVFVGPNPEAMGAMGDKIFAKESVSKRGVPVVPGSGGIKDLKEAKRAAGEIGYPVLIKAALGGGGKGMRIVNQATQMEEAFKLASQESGAAFGDPTVYVEKLISEPRHIEFQILADNYGNVIHLYERECSIQRRHQKLVEETPSTALDDILRTRMGEAAVEAAKAVGYTNAGTIEFMFEEGGNFYFMEMNTRLQVEHPVTEITTGVDLVKEQLKIASGEKLSFSQDGIRKEGAAIECRIYAEDPQNSFLPSPGKIDVLREPSGPGVRVESGVYQGYEIPVYYDPLIAKLITWGRDRDEAIRRMSRALSEYRIVGVKTTAGFHQMVMGDERFVSGKYNTSFIEQMDLTREEERRDELVVIASSIAALRRGRENRKAASSKEKGMNPWKLAGRREALGE